MTMLEDLIELHREVHELHGTIEVEIHAHSFDALAGELRTRNVDISPGNVDVQLFGIPVIFDSRMAMGAFELVPRRKP